jgi:hypothetical protein
MLRHPAVLLILGWLFSLVFSPSSLFSKFGK